MSIHPDVTDQDLINLGRLTEQQKNQRADRIKIKTLDETHDKKLAESLEPTTEKVEEVNDSHEKVTEVLKESDSEIENQQEVVSVETNTDDSEDENDNYQSHIRTLPSNSNFSDQLT